MDYDEAVAITRDIYWVGCDDPGAELRCNPYLLIDDEEVVLFDPGSIPQFPVIMRKVIDLIAPERVSWIVVSHQDPDVCGNLAVIEDVIGNPNLRIATHSLTAALIRHLGLSAPLHAVDRHDLAITLAGGRELRFVPTPFLHAPGAIATYDAATRSLFTSDLFGGLSAEWSLLARDGYLDAIRRFHSGYMPSGAVLAACMKTLSALDIDRILPQHGSVLEGGQVRDAIGLLSDLPCGIDLLAS